MTHDEIINLDNQYIMETYGRFSVVPSHGKNAVIYDYDGTEYIDFTSGIGVNSLGIADAEWITAVKDQIEKISHISNYFYSHQSSILAEKLIKLSGMSRVFFGNSGAEANEGAIKTARKYSYDKYGEGRSTIVSLKQSFHGRTITTLAATGQDVFHTYFHPFTDGFKYAELNDINDINKALTDDVCAILVEPVQGEGGVNIMSAEYAEYLRKICDEKDLLLIFDEIQTGIGRTGKMFAFENFNIIPDIITLAKGLGGGLPIGVFICGDKCDKVLGRSHHGTTFGANPVVCAGANAVIDKFDEQFLKEINEKGTYIKQKVADMNIAEVKDIRGLGLMIGIQVDGDLGSYLKKSVDKGLLILRAGTDVLRFLPPLTITYEEIDKGLKIFETIFS